jgi:hypothetical protein
MVGVKSDIYLETFEINIFFNNKENKENKDHYDTNDNKRSELCPYDTFSQNEVKITNILKNIDQYHIYFNLFVEQHNVKLGQLNDRNMDRMDCYDDNNILFIYNDKHKIDFSTFITSFETPRHFLLNLFESYRELLKILCITQNMNLCIFNVSPQNILFDESFKPQISNFKKTFAFITRNIDLKEYLKNEDYVYKPIELHILYYLLNNEDFKLNDENIDLISSKFLSEIKIFQHFSTTFKIEYKYKIAAFLKQYLNKSNDEIVTDILKYSNTWDNYSISIIYLHIISNIITFFALREGFFVRFFQILTKNIEPDPLKRQNIYETSEQYDNLFNYYTNWDFVSNIPENKLTDLYELLNK